MTLATRRGLMVVIAVAAAAGVALLSASMYETRRGQRNAYREAQARQWRAVGATRARPAVEAAPLPRRRRQCVQGVEGFAAAVQRAFVPMASEDPPPRRLASVLKVSEMAVLSERQAELTHPAPTLPKRMGTHDGAAVAPEPGACDGAGYAELQGIYATPIQLK